MPLHPERETARIRHPEGLDETVGRTRFDGERGRQLLHALPVQGVDLQTVGARDIAQLPAGLEQHLVRRPVLFFEIQILIVAVVKVARHFVYALPECAAVGDVHFLESAANRQHRQTGGDGPRNQRKRRSIPIWIM
jgi:hypothetical protein